MRPLNLLAFLLFLSGATWALTRSERTVREIQSTYYAWLRPFLNAGSELEIKARSFLEEVEDSKKLEAELASMRTEYDRLRQIEAHSEEINAENARLRRALDFQERTEFKATAARVIRRQPTNWWQTVEIDRGKEHGISIHQPVVADGGLVGKVDRVDKDFSSVILLTDEACQVSVQVEGTPEAGILGGQRGQYEDGPKLRLRFLSVKAQIAPGTRVFTNGRGGIFPANLLVGTIESVIPGPLDSEALVRPSVDFTDLGTVFLLPKQ
ncbi:MAG: rod shape-determining protein MreC [Verrucomicrobia bacterium]|nr:MAG: rod shape-determining protein MreC [Verrucomicrobiota bacterium]TAE88926.1 MAG: rod shape-determining protein MreC [Verrucomicrobiota bacterium]TAF27342.1 MAG: rod shape-determining protein MreC [Verrucomicrobiota bacterium]TAF42367.1 MAG: rod shape-determining protein MreC [Verrucomicrobiota bacterium]